MSAEKSEVLVSEREGDTTIKVKDVNGVPLQQVGSFKYLGSELMAEGGVNAAVKQRVQTAWNKWREITGMICDRKIARKLKCKMYKCVIRPGYCMEQSAGLWKRRWKN